MIQSLCEEPALGEAPGGPLRLLCVRAVVSSLSACGPSQVVSAAEGACQLQPCAVGELRVALGLSIR